MKYGLLKDLVVFAALALLQVMVLSHIQLFGFATPMLCVYFVMLFRRHYPRWALLLWSFLMGVVVDSFSNTPGVASASMTLVSMIQPPLLEAFMQRESDENLKPSLRSLGLANYLFYSSILIFVFVASLFTLETFSFFNWTEWLESIGGSFVFTLIMVIVIESVRKD